ncbi:MAG: alpha/beta hydrolase [Byssovorax sp.]
MPFASINGQEIHFEDSGGPGLPVVLGHGFLMDQSMFDPQVAVLAPEHRVIRWDARGFGQTRWDGRPFSYWDLADDVVGLLDHLGIAKAVVGGMSQGGFSALRVALRWPERVRGLVLISSQAGTEAAEALGGYTAMLDTWEAMGAIDPLIEAVAGLILGSRTLWEPWTTRMRALPKENVRAPGMCLFLRDDVTSRLIEIPFPAIVFHGTADASIPMERAEALARGLPGCERLVRIEGASHASNLSHPEAVNGPLLAFLRGLAARSEAPVTACGAPA